MDYFVAFKQFKGKNLNSENIIIEPYTPLERRGSFILFNKAPFCVWNSQVAKDYLIWDGDNEYEKRLKYENGILFEDRCKIWYELVDVYDRYGEKIGTKKVDRIGRFSPNEASFMRKTWSQFFEKDETLRFNDYFFVGSHIEEVRNLYEYLYK